MNDVLYAGGASPATGTGGGDIDVSGLLKTDASNLAPAGRETIAGIAVASVSLDNLADVNLSNLSENGKTVVAGIVAENVNLDNLADKDLSNLSSAGNAKLPHPWVYFAAKNILANGTIGANKVSTFALDFLPDEGLYEIMGSVFFTSSSIVTIRGALNPSIYDAIASSPTAGVFLTTGESRCAGFYAALVNNKTIRFSNTGNNEATNGYINVIAYRKVGD